jgi:hypothetical protein
VAPTVLLCLAAAHALTSHVALPYVLPLPAEIPAAAGSALGVAQEAPTVLLSRAVPGCSTLTELCCQTITPGRKYWLQASLHCKVSPSTTLPRIPSACASKRSRSFHCPNMVCPLSCHCSLLRVAPPPPAPTPILLPCIP